MKSMILIVAMAAWLLAASCETDPSSSVNADGSGTGKATGSREQAAPTSVPQSRFAQSPDHATRSTAREDLGVPLYPGADAAEANRSVPPGVEDLAAQQGLVTSLFFSKDPIADVAAFYQQSLQDLEPRVYEMDLPSGRMVNIMLRRGGRDTNIVLSETREKSGTLIRITRIVE